VAADISVVVCSLNGAAGLGRCLTALAAQRGGVGLEVIVVDDGSTDDTSEVARAGGARVIRHEVNRGIGAARNTGVRAASAPVVAFVDDDCEPEPDWARRLLDGYGDGVAGVGGEITVCGPDGFMLGYLRRHNPLTPLEIALARGGHVVYRFGLYLRRQWRPEPAHGVRDVFSFVGANMSFRRDVLLRDGFDERFRFGGEELDFCKKLSRDEPGRLVLVPGARVRHHFVGSLSDTLRRSRAYGRASARLYRKWPELPPTIFPGPPLTLAVAVASAWYPPLLAAAALLPPLMYPRGVRTAVAERRPGSLGDAYLQLAQEAWEDVGFAEGLWRFRRFTPEPKPRPARPAEPLA